jgi:N-acetyl-anhydromuramyl-L-alanine amidase AmpD
MCEAGAAALAKLPQVADQPRAQRVVSLIVLHCAATPNGRHVTVYDVDTWHAARGFARRAAAVERFNPNLRHIGYHYLVDLLGQVYTGRAETEIGAHVSGSNANSLAVCMVGTSRFNRQQWAALAQLVAALRQRYPGARVVGHRDLSPDLNGDGIVQPQEWLKTCPGFDVSRWVRAGMTALPEHLVAD